MNFINRNKDKIFKYLFVAGTVVFIYLTVNYFFGYISPFVLGFLFSLAFEPLVRFAGKRTKLGRGISALICVFLLIIIIGFLFTGIILQLISQGRAFITFAISYIDSLPVLISGWQSDYHNFMLFLPDEFSIALSDLFSGVLSGIASSLGSLLRNNTGNIASFAASFLLGTLLMLISTFFFIKDRFQIWDFVISNTPEWLLKAFISIRNGVAGAFLGYMKSQLLLMAPTAVICFIGLKIIGYPFSLFVSLLIAFFDMLPLFGAGMILGPWAVLSFITGSIMSGVTLIIIYCVILITRQVLEPKVIGRQIGLHPLITLMSIYIGLKVFGVFGFFIGPMTVVIIKALIYGEQSKIKKEKT